MAHLSSTSPLRALYRVFVLPALSKNISTSTTTTRPAAAAAATAFQLHHHHPCSRRSFSLTPSSLAKTRPAERRSQKWDSEITALQIQLVDPSTNTLSEPRTRYDILNNLDTRTHRLVQLSPDEPGTIPVCKIVSKKEVYEHEKKKKLQAKESKKLNARGSEAGMKTLELNWAIEKGDLAHRLEKLKGFLEEGRRVEVCFRGKKRGRKASLEECERVLEQVRGLAEGVEGVREKGGLEGNVGGVASLEFVVKGGGGGGGGAKKEGGKGREQEEEEEEDGDGDEGGEEAVNK